jgi:tripartite-type tricarboxylate transporter receptor subunit TctC
MYIMPPTLGRTLAFALALLPALVGAAEYPTKSIRMIVPFVAGGGTDLLARLIAPRLGDVLQQQIVIDNRGGAGSIVGSQIVAKSVPDGYTLGMFDTAFAINPALYEKLPYDYDRDFNIVAIMATSPTLLITHNGLKVKTIQDFIAYAKAAPGKIRFASAGVGSSSHLTGEILKMHAKIDMIHIPYKGAGAAIIDILGGHADATFVVPGTVKQHIQNGTIVPIAVAGNKPSANLPGVPTFAAAGLAAVNPGAFRFVSAPAGLPAPVVKRLIGALRTTIETPELATRLIDNDYEPAFLPFPESRGYIENEVKKWRVAVKASGAKPN